MSSSKVRLWQTVLIVAVLCVLAITVGSIILAVSSYNPPLASRLTFFGSAVFLLILSVVVDSVILGSQSAQFAIWWRKHTGLNFESAPISWAVKCELRRQQWGERNTLWKIGLDLVDANAEVDELEKRIAKLESEEKGIDQRLALPSQARDRKAARYWCEKDLRSARKSLNKTKKEAWRFSKRFLAAWDFFKVHVYGNHKPVNPKTGRQCGPNAYLDWIRSVRKSHGSEPYNSLLAAVLPPIPAIAAQPSA